MQTHTTTKRAFILIPLLICLSNCSHKESAPVIPYDRAVAKPYFKTHWQNESQFIIESITADLAEMVCFAKSQKLPPEGRLTIDLAEWDPFYRIVVQLPERGPLTNEIKMVGPIWEPELYQPLTAALLKLLDVHRQPKPTQEPANLDLINTLESLSPETIEKENAKLSQQLAADFRNPALHEKAAVLVGAFALREFSENFYDVRLPLCRMTAHLALAKTLHQDSSYSVYGQLAEAVLYTLMNNQKDALEMLAKLEKTQPQLVRWTRSLKARNTADYRLVHLDADCSLLEANEWCFAYCRSVDSSLPWEKLMERSAGQRADYCRIINSGTYSVETGHGLLKLSLPLEFKEIDEVSRLALKTKLGKTNLIAELNRLPERCFSGPGDRPKVRIIGWGQWAMFFQRHLCHAVENNFYFMNKKWGVPDDARQFAAGSGEMLSGLRLYPLLQRMNCTDKASYHQSVDEGLLVTVDTPHLVPPMGWSYLCWYAPPFAEPYHPNPNVHFNEWFRHNPPQGTAYDMRARLDQPTMALRPDAVTELERIHQIAPWDDPVSGHLVRKKYKQKANFVQEEEVFHPLLEYSTHAMFRLANVSSNDPPTYEKWMLKSAELNPHRYYTLGEYFRRKDEGKSVAYTEKGLTLCPDAVAGAARAGWLVRYYQKIGQIKKAEELADWAADVYSHAGLRAKAEFLESTGRYADAFDYYNKINERYDSAGDLLGFCYRYKAKTGDPKYDPIVKKHLQDVFPDGIEHARLTDFKSPPADGVLIREDNELLQESGLHKGDIIVAVYGIRVHTFAQYDFGRYSETAPEMNLIVWEKDRYEEITASPPDHRFNADFKTFRRRP